MNKKSNKTIYTFIGIALLAIMVFAAGWYYLQSQKTTIQIVSDSSNYFTVDKPVVELKLLNPKNANSGEIGLKFTEDVIKVTDSKFADGVTLRNLGGKYVFELDDTYFSSRNEIVATLTFENVSYGTVNFEIDEELTSIRNNEIELDLQFRDLSIGVGVAPVREKEQMRDKGTFDSF